MKPGPFLAHLCQSSATPGPFHGVDGPLAEDRTHVRIEDETLAAEEGALFAAGRLAFDAPLDDAVEHGLAVEIEGADSLDLSGVWRLGGKGSLVEAARTEPRATDFDAIRQAAIETLGQAEGRFRWVLVTPARFPRGWLPSFIADNGTGTFPFTNVQVHLRAAVVGRPMAYSGWDLAANGSSAGRSRGEPRPTRLFVPSGSVYFFEVSGGGVEEARRIAERAWLKPLAEVRIDEGSNPARRRAVAIDRACGLARGMFGPWNWYDPEEEQ
jgi:CRISPR type III-B/RAMP module-associated protein Cmr3